MKQQIFVHTLLLLVLFVTTNCAPAKMNFVNSQPNPTSTATGTRNDGNDADPVVPSPIIIGQLTSHTNTMTVGNKVDVLIVDDNSLSMSEDQAKLGAKLQNLISKFQNLDWKIAITTTDVSDGYSNTSYKGGNLIPLISDYKNQTQAGGSILTSNTNNLSSLFFNTVSIKRSGSSDERAIVSARYAIQHNQDNWIRSDAHLAVIVLSDEDERSDGSNFTDEDKPENFLPFVNTKFGSKKTASFHSIIQRPSDNVCADLQAQQTIFDPWTGEIKYNKDGSIQKGGNNFGSTYARLSSLSNGIVGDICADDYGKELENIGQRITENVSAINLDCTPVEDASNKVAVNFVPALVNQVSYKVVGKQLVFDSNISAGTKITVNYKCAN